MTRVGVFTPDEARELKRLLGFMNQTGYALLGRRPKVFAPGPTPIYICNEADETIPPYGCMQVTGTREENERSYVLVDQPTDEFGVAGPYLFNGPREISATDVVEDRYGIGDPGLETRGISKLSSVTVGGQYRPESGTWKLWEKPGGQFICMGADDVGTGSDQVMRVITNHRVEIKTFRAPSGGIAAASSETSLSSATCDWYEKSGSSLVAKTDADSTQITDIVFNMGDEAVAANAYIQAVVIDDGFVANWERC